MTSSLPSRCQALSQAKRKATMTIVNRLCIMWLGDADTQPDIQPCTCLISLWSRKLCCGMERDKKGFYVGVGSSWRQGSRRSSVWLGVHTHMCLWVWGCMRVCTLWPSSCWRREVEEGVITHAKVRDKASLRKMLRHKVSMGQLTQRFISCASLTWGMLWDLGD